MSPHPQDVPDMPNGMSMPSGAPPPCSMPCCMTGMAPATWQQAQWPSWLPDSSSGRNDKAWPHGMSPWLPCVLNTHNDMPNYLGMSPRLRRAIWEAMKAARSHSTSPAMAPNPTMRHWPCNALNTLNDVFVPLGTSPGVPNAGLMTPRQAETAGMPPNGGIVPHDRMSSPDVPRRVWVTRHVIWTLNNGPPAGNTAPAMSPAP